MIALPRFFCFSHPAAHKLPILCSAVNIDFDISLLGDKFVNVPYNTTTKPA